MLPTKTPCATCIAPYSPTLADFFFTGSPFTVEVERNLSEQQQFLDVVILRRGPGRFVGRLPDGLDGVSAHNLITFKSHRETLADCAGHMERQSVMRYAW